MVRLEISPAMLTYSFDKNAAAPLYVQLYQYIRNDIISGVLRAGEHLPSKRSFAANLGISTITIENAYSQLMSEGYIYSIPKKGYFVSKLADFSRIPGNYDTAFYCGGNPLSSEPGKNLGGMLLHDGDDRSAYTAYTEGNNCDNRNHVSPYLADFASNRTNPDNFPFSIWSKLLREELSEKKAELMTQAPSCGIYKLRKSIASHLRAFRGMRIAPEQIVVGAGTEYLYGLLIQLLGRDKTYCVENPGYSKIAQIYESNGVRFRYADMDKSGLSAAALRESDADIVHISPTHHFPTGITMPISRRYELLAWAAERDGRYIIEDDYDSEFRLTGNPIPSLQSIDACEKVIYINTFSKSLASTIRISYMVLPPKLAEQFSVSLSFYSCTVSNFEQYTLAEFIDGGYFEKHINRMRLYYGRQREAILNAIQKSPLADFVTIIEEDSGLHFLVKIKTDLTDELLIKKLLADGIHITGLSAYYASPIPEAEHTFIINYSNIDTEKLPEIMKVMARNLELSGHMK